MTSAHPKIIKVSDVEFVVADSRIERQLRRVESQCSTGFMLFMYKGKSLKIGFTSPITTSPILESIYKLADNLIKEYEKEELIEVVTCELEKLAAGEFSSEKVGGVWAVSVVVLSELGILRYDETSGIYMYGVLRPKKPANRRPKKTL